MLIATPLYIPFQLETGKLVNLGLLRGAHKAGGATVYLTSALIGEAELATVMILPANAWVSQMSGGGGAGNNVQQKS